MTYSTKPLKEYVPSYETIETYVKSKAHAWAETTQVTAKAKLNAMYRLQCATPEELFKELKMLEHSMHTIQVYFQIWRDFERFCYKGKSPTDSFLKNNRLLFKNAYQTKTYLLTTEQFNALLSEALKIHRGLYNMLVLMGCSGLRLSEALDAKWSDIDASDMLRVEGKGRKVRLVPVPRKKLISIPSQKDNLICDSAPPFRKFFSDKPCTPHDLRAFFATTISESVSIDELMSLLGHSSFSTALRYMRRNPKVIKEKMNDYFKNFPDPDGSTDRSDKNKSKVG